LWLRVRRPDILTYNKDPVSAAGIPVDGCYSHWRRALTTTLWHDPRASRLL